MVLCNGHISAMDDPIHSLFGCGIELSASSPIEWCYFQFYQTQDSGFHRRLLPTPSILMKI